MIEQPPADAPTQPSLTKPSGSAETWSRIGHGLVAAGIVAGRFAGRMGVKVGSAVSWAYHAVDPDLRRHIADLPLMGLTLLAPGRPTVTPLPDDGANVVLFVHGLGGHPGNFFPMRSYFKLRQRTRSYAVSFPIGRPIAELATLLSAFVEEAARVNALPGGARVDLVAHSMGGLVARAALEDEATRARVATLVTLGTPHEGTHLARLAKTVGTLDLRPTSEFLASLRAQIPWAGPPSMPRLVAFWSGADMMLLPHETGRVEGGENVEVARATHFGYLLEPTVWEQVVLALSPS